MSGSELTALGLLLDIVGATLLWGFGLPLDVRRGRVRYIILEQHDPIEKRRAQVYDVLSHIGMALLIAGFGLQLFGAL
jgi:hypothetical protein